MILDSLRYWVSECMWMGPVDPGPVMSRDMSGIPVKDPPILWSIESDPILAGTKIIAEAWDLLAFTRWVPYRRSLCGMEWPLS